MDYFFFVSSNISKVPFKKKKIKGKKLQKKSCLSLSSKKSFAFVLCVCSNEKKTQREGGSRGDDDGKRGGGGEDQEEEEESEAMGDVLERGVDDGRDVLRRLLR